jgi:general secretion pathway protein D
VNHGSRVLIAAALIVAGAPSSRLAAQDADAAAADTVTIRFVDADLRAVVQALGRYMSKPVLAAGVPELPVTLETPGPVARSSVTELLRGLVETHGLELTEDSAFYRVAPRAQAAAPAVAMPAGGPQGPVQLFVIRLKHAHASDVAATINQLYGGAGDFSGRPGLSTGTLSDELRRTAAATQAQPGAVPGATGPPGTHATIVPDLATNSLLIRATAEDYAVLQQAVDQLDIRPLQVLIEVLIVEARRDKSFSLGADIDLAPQSLGGGATAEAQTLGAGLGDVIVRFMDLGKGRIDAILTLAESRGNVRIVSRPVLMASNNTEARFLVGSQRPFVQVSRSLPTDAPSRDQVVQYKDVGTKLTVRPTINQDGYVSLVIQQEINAATNETQFDAPVISTREASTQVLVKDGQTIVLGGLRDEQSDRTRSGVPILSGIPIIGGVFGRQTRRSSYTELFLFLTPRILRTDEEVDAETTARMPEGVAP